MKTGPNSFFYAMRMACFALMLSAMMARCQTYGGIFAQDGVTFNGHVIIDSFDSSDPDHSIWQSNSLYRANYFNPGTAYGIWSNSLSYVSNSFPSRTADVTVFAASNVVNLSGRATIAGYIATGPSGTETLGANASVGDLAWCFGANGSGSGQLGLEPGHWITNANVNFQSYPLPSPVNPVNGWMNWSNVPTLGNGSMIKIGGIWWYTNGVWTNIGGIRYTNTGSGFTIDGTTYSMVITNRLQNTNYVYYSMNQLKNQNLFVDAQYVVLYLTNGL
ncbi:MAG TPA: hypothetical protein VMO20_05210, partial [Candidatus Acidoferrum sp.]|nr:hypothetical protein [Candidatus Acidoferrum sp.]